jgi:anti-anti-sigma factor
MEISDREQSSFRVVSVQGRLDASTSPQLQSHFETLMATGTPFFVLDLVGVDYLSSGGLRMLLFVTKKVKALDGGLVIANVHPFVEDLMTMAGFNKLIPAADSVDEAIKLLEKGDSA